jgi:hypothetical protein
MNIYKNYFRAEMMPSKAQSIHLFIGMIISEQQTGKYVEGGDCGLVLGNTLEWVWRD